MVEQAVNKRKYNNDNSDAQNDSRLLCLHDSTLGARDFSSVKEHMNDNSQVTHKPQVRQQNIVRI